MLGLKLFYMLWHMPIGSGYMLWDLPWCIWLWGTTSSLSLSSRNAFELGLGSDFTVIYWLLDRVGMLLDRLCLLSNAWHLGFMHVCLGQLWMPLGLPMFDRHLELLLGCIWAFLTLWIIDFGCHWMSLTWQRFMLWDMSCSVVATTVASCMSCSLGCVWRIDLVTCHWYFVLGCLSSWACLYAFSASGSIVYAWPILWAVTCIGAVYVIGQLLTFLTLGFILRPGCCIDVCLGLRISYELSLLLWICFHFGQTPICVRFWQLQVHFA